MKHHCMSIAIKIMIYKNNKLDVPKGTSLIRAGGSLSQTVLDEQKLRTFRCINYYPL